MSAGAREISVYDRMCWPDGELERALARGAHRLELMAYLGASEYQTLSQLAQQAERTRRRSSKRVRGAAAAAAPTTVYLLPGILGSQLGRARSATEPPDLLWLDPADIVAGRLLELRCAEALESVAALQPLGAVVYSYLALKLRLCAAGFNVIFHDYDWRADLRTAAQALALRLAADGSEQLALVAHSMGGLLARSALTHYGQRAGAERIRRVVGIGVPHAGSIAAVQALRATYPVVCRLAAIDRLHDVETLTRVVFRSFPSLYQMLPTLAGLDLFDPAQWPRGGSQPEPALLHAARDFSAQLASADQRFVSLIGTGQRTVTGLAVRGEQFRYAISAAGDGTVAAACATLPGARNYSVRGEHSELPRSETVALAVVDLLRRGHTRRLRAGVNARAGRSAFVSDNTLRRLLGGKRDWAAMSLTERRRYLRLLNAPPAAYRARAKG